MPKGVISTATKVNTTLKYTGKALLFITIVADGIRLLKALDDDINVKEEIKDYEDVLDALRQDLKEETDQDKWKRTEEAIMYSV